MKGLTSLAWELVHELLRHGGSINEFFLDQTPLGIKAADELIEAGLAEKVLGGLGLSLIIKPD